MATQIFLEFSPRTFGEDEHNLTSIFFVQPPPRGGSFPFGCFFFFFSQQTRDLLGSGWVMCVKPHRLRLDPEDANVENPS